MAKQNPGLAPERGQPSYIISFISILPILSALGVIAGLVYSLGLIILSVRITSRVHNFSTAWYAATLVSNKVVLGQGLRVFFTPLVLPALVFLVIGIWMTLARERAGQHPEEEQATPNFWTRVTRPMEAQPQLQNSINELPYFNALWEYSYSIIFSLYIVLVLLYYIVGMLISLMILFAVQGHTKIIQFAMNAPLDFIIIQLSALLSIIFIFSIAYADSRRQTPVLHRILKVIVVVYLFAVVLGISGYRYTFDLPLPKVTVETTIPGQPVIDGRLLTYINPNWYILRDINDHDDVIALSNDKIISTVIH